MRFFLSSLGNNIWQRRDKMFTGENFYLQGTYEKKTRKLLHWLSLLCVYSSFRLGRYWWSNYMVRRQTKEDWELKKGGTIERTRWRQRLESQRKKTPPYLLFNQEKRGQHYSISRWTIKYKRFHLHNMDVCYIECATYLFASAIAYFPCGDVVVEE